MNKGQQTQEVQFDSSTRVRVPSTCRSPIQRIDSIVGLTKREGGTSFLSSEDLLTSTRHRNRTRAAAFADLDARRHGGGYFFYVSDDADHAPCFTAQFLQRLGHKL